MKYTQITTDWNAAPNDPQVQFIVDTDLGGLAFYLNSLLFDNYHLGDKANVTFLNCHKYSFNNMNDRRKPRMTRYLQKMRMLTFIYKHFN